MSSPTTIQNEHASDFELPVPRTIAQAAVRKLVSPVQFIGFWMAIALPFVYLPVLYRGDLSTNAGIFSALLLLNLVAVIAGHGYNRD
ncbi:hypothetical protein [Haladaptatus sp. NG-SE-30]